MAQSNGFKGLKGLHLDPARRQLSAAKVCEIIENAAKAGFNAIHLHLLDDQGCAVQLHEAVQIPTHGTLPPWSFEEQADIGLKCRACGITPILELGMPGHSVALKSFLRMLRGESSTFEVEKRYGVITEDLITVDDTGADELETVLELFAGLCDRFGVRAGELVHMGGDELGGLNTAFKNLKIKTVDTIASPTHGSWNYTRLLVTRVCAWAAERQLRVIAWEDIFQRLFGYQAGYVEELGCAIENVDNDMPIQKLVSANGSVVVFKEGMTIPPGGKLEYRPLFSNAQLEKLVFKMPDNLLMQQWKQSPKYEWQRFVVPKDRTIVSDGYYLDMMDAGPLDMFRTKMDPSVAGYIACVWGERIGEESIDSTLYPMMWLLGSKFSSDGRSDTDILRQWLATRAAPPPDTWKMREWLGFGEPKAGDKHHLMSTPMSPPRTTKMVMVEAMHPVFSDFLAEFYVHMCALVESGTRVPDTVADRIVTQLVDASRDFAFKIPATWSKDYDLAPPGDTTGKKVVEMLARAMLAQHSKSDHGARCKFVSFVAGRIKNIQASDANKFGILYPKRAKGAKEDPHTILFRNGMHMVLQGITRCCKKNALRDA